MGFSFLVFTSGGLGMQKGSKSAWLPESRQRLQVWQLVKRWVFSLVPLIWKSDTMVGSLPAISKVTFQGRKALCLYSCRFCSHIFYPFFPCLYLFFFAHLIFLLGPLAFSLFTHSCVFVYALLLSLHPFYSFSFFSASILNTGIFLTAVT